jgi:long-subunit fatty acid transport protein
VAIALQPTDATLVTAQVDWTQWSRFEQLVVDVGSPFVYDLDWEDVLTIRIGGRVRISDRLVLRGGVLSDSSAVPDRTIERQYLDAEKYGASIGSTIGLTGTVVLDLAASWVGGPARVVRDNSMGLDSPWHSNIAPGEHSGHVYTLATGLRFAL